MPEGPEVRKYADALDAVLTGRVVTTLEARTRDARKWLQENESRVVGHRVSRVISHGKHLIGYIDGGFYFHSHLMMWGRWQTFGPAKISGNRKPRAGKRTSEAEPLILPDKDRRERARIVVEGGAAILMSAPIFNVGEGDPYDQIENLTGLGPDVLPYDGKFDENAFERRLRLREHQDVPIGAALLNQRIAAGLGNYLRAEVLFSCRLDPWRKVSALTDENLSCLIRNIPRMAKRAYKRSATAVERDRKRMASDPSLVYQPGREYGTRHLVFRRTNLPCLRCGQAIKQLRQETHNPDRSENEESRTRIVYFCARCQGVNLDSVRAE